MRKLYSGPIGGDKRIVKRFQLWPKVFQIRETDKYGGWKRGILVWFEIVYIHQHYTEGSGIRGWFDDDRQYLATKEEYLGG